MILQIDQDAPKLGKVDVCIVGGGAAGIAIAVGFANSRHKVVVLEEGGLSADDSLRDGYEILPGTPPKMGRSSNRRLFLGGNTNHWYGNCRPLDQRDFTRRPWSADSEWPISFSDIEESYVRAQEFCGLGKFHAYQADSVAHRLESEFGCALINSRSLATRIVQTAPTFSAADMHRKTLEEADNIVLILGSHVTDIVGGGNGNASEVNVVHASGLEFSIPARTFVLATGGVENAKLLLNSANLLDRRSADCVGRFFQEHWYYVFNSEVPDDGSGDLGFYLVGEGRTIDELGEKRRFIDGAHVWGQLVVSDSELVKNQIPGLAIWFTEGGAPDALHNFRHPRQYRGEWHELVLNAVKEGGGIAAYLWRRLLGRRNPSRRFTMFAQVEQIPSRQSRVCLSKHLDQWGWPDVEIATELDLAERRMHAVGLRLVARELGLDGDDLVSKMERKYANSQFGYFWHHLGTTRMGEDPSRSVVDRNCRVHGTENLYVAGGSVFVTSGTAAPTLTIVALALRLASHLRSSLAAVD